MAKQLGKTTELATVCPWCGAKHDVASHVSEEKSPSSGDFSLCIECGEWSVFDHRFQLRKPTDAEYDLIAADEDTRRHRAAWLKVKAKRGLP